MKKSFTNLIKLFTVISVLLFATNTYAQFTVTFEGGDPVVFTTFNAAMDTIKKNTAIAAATITVAEGEHVAASGYTAGIGRPVVITVQGAGAANTWLMGYADDAFPPATSGKMLIQASDNTKPRSKDDGLEMIFKDISFRNWGFADGVSTAGAIFHARRVQANTSVSFINCNFRDIRSQNGAIIRMIESPGNKSYVDNCSFTNINPHYGNGVPRGMFSLASGTHIIKNSTFYNCGKFLTNAPTTITDRWGVIISLYHDNSYPANNELVLENNIFINTKTINAPVDIIFPLISVVSNGVNTQTITTKSNVFIGNEREGKPNDCDIYFVESDKIILSESFGNLANKVIKNVPGAGDFSTTIPGFDVDENYTYTHEKVNFLMDGVLPQILVNTEGVNYAQYSGAAVPDPLFVVPSDQFPTLSSALDSVKNSPLLSAATVFVKSGTHIVAGEYTMSMGRPVQITIQGEGAASTWIAGYEDADYSFLTTSKRFLLAHNAADNGLDLIFKDISFKNFGISTNSSNGFIRAGNATATTKFSFINCNFRSITARVNAIIGNTGNAGNETLIENCSFSNIFIREKGSFDSPIIVNAGKLTVRNSTFYSNIKDPRGSTNIDGDKKVGSFFGIGSSQNLEVIFENNVFINNQVVPEGGNFIHPVIAVKNGNNDKITTITMNNNIFIGNLREDKNLDCDIYVEDTTTVIFNSASSGNIANRLMKRNTVEGAVIYSEGTLPGFKIATGFTYDHASINFVMDTNTGLPQILADSRGVDYATYSGNGGDFVTNPATDIASNTATLHAKIFNVPDPAPSQHGFVWATTEEPNLESNKSELGAVTEATTFSSEISNLVPNTVYYVRAYLTNDAGTVYGGQVSFKTAPLNTLVLTGAFTASDKEYDGNFSAGIDVTGLTVEGLVTGFENVVLSNVMAVFSDSAASAENKAVSIISAELAGEHGGLYVLSLLGAPVSAAKINAKELSITGTFIAKDKNADGTMDAEILENSLTLSGVVGTEVVELINVVAAFSQAGPGVGLTVSLTSAEISGLHAGNYTLSLAGAPTAIATINDPTGRNESTSAKFTVYPNPFTGVIYFNSNEIAKVSLTNITGQKVLERNLQGEQQLSTSHLHKGIYLLNVEYSSGEMKVMKLVKK